MVLGGDGMECTVQQNDGQVLYGSLYNGDFSNRSINGGSSWQSISDNVPGTPSEPGLPFWDRPNDAHYYIRCLSASIQIYRQRRQLDIELASCRKYTQPVKDSASTTASFMQPDPMAICGGQPMAVPPGRHCSRQQPGLPGHFTPTMRATLWAVKAKPYLRQQVVPNQPMVAYQLDQYFGHPANIPANCIVYRNGSQDGVYVSMDVVFITATIPWQIGCCSIRSLPIIEVTELRDWLWWKQNFAATTADCVIWSLQSDRVVSNPRRFQQSLECECDLAVWDPIE